MAETEDSRAKRRAYMRAWFAANRERTRATNRAWQTRNPEKQAYGVHKVRAKLRGIPFLMTFEEWWAVWHESGKWDQRGSRRDQYVMARYRDLGAYAVGNVRICTAAENLSEQAVHLTVETRQLRSNNAKRQHQADPLMRERFKRFTEASRGIPRSEEVRRKISVAQIGKFVSTETRAKLSEAAKAQWARKRVNHP